MVAPTLQSLHQMYVYKLARVRNPDQKYIGKTDNPTRRLAEHNSGKSVFTSKGRPWKYDWVVWIAEEKKAAALERYFKSHSGRAFAKKHF